MRKKPSNHLKGASTPGSWLHSWELSAKNILDAAAQHLEKEKNSVRMMTVSLPIPNARARAEFPSDLSAMRSSVTDNFGYRIPRLVPGVAVPVVKVQVGAGRPRTLQLAYGTVTPGEPDLDAGVAGWEQPEDTEQYPVRGLRMSKLLATINRVEGEAGKGKGAKITTRAPESSKLENMGGGVIERVATDGASVMFRDTLTASPYLSRALQMMCDDGYTDLARWVGEEVMEPIASAYERMFRGPRSHAKVSAMLPHCHAGHYHYDLYNHASYLETVTVGTAGKKMPARLWDGRAGCHHGPGPGVSFWLRHMAVLGDLDELAKTEPEAAEGARMTKMVCDQTMASAKKRSALAFEKAMKEKSRVEAAGGVCDKWIRPADDFARDVRIHREVDFILADYISMAIPRMAVQKNYLGAAKAEYRQHLIDAYAAGNTGLRMDTPQDLETAAGVAARAELRVREEREAAEAALLEAQAARAEAARLRVGIEADRAAAIAERAAAEKDRRLAGIFLASSDSRQAALEAREKNMRELTTKAGLWDRASALIGRMLELSTAAEKTSLATIAGADRGDCPVAEIGTAKRVFCRLLRLAGLVPGAEKGRQI